MPSETMKMRFLFPLALGVLESALHCCRTTARKMTAAVATIAHTKRPISRQNFHGRDPPFSVCLV